MERYICKKTSNKLFRTFLTLNLMFIFLFFQQNLARANSSEYPFKSTDMYFEVITESATIYQLRSNLYVPIGSLSVGDHFIRTGSQGIYHTISYGRGTAFVPMANTKPSTLAKYKSSPKKTTDKPNLATDLIMLDTIYVKDYADLTKTIAVINKGERYPLVQNLSTSSALIKIAGRAGVIDRKLTRIAFQTNNLYFSIAYSDVPLYEKQQEGYVVVGYLQKGQSFKRISDDGQYHKIKYANGFAYVKVAETNVLNSTFTANTAKNSTNWFRVTKTTNVLTTNNSKSPRVITKLLPGTELPYISNKNGFYSIDIGGRLGYVRVTDTIVGFGTSNQYFQANVNDLPIYQSPNTTSNVLGNLAGGKLFVRISDLGAWHKIKFGNTEGYVKKVNTLPVTLRTTNNNGEIQTLVGNNDTLLRNLSLKDTLRVELLDNVEVYTAETGNNLIAVLPANSTYMVIRENASKTMYQVSISGRLGWITSDRNFVRTTFSESDTSFVADVEQATIYQKDGDSYVAVGSLEKGNSYLRLGEEGSYHVISFGNQRAYVLKEETKKTSDQVQNPITSQSSSLTNVKTMNETPVLLQPSSDSPVIGILSENTIYSMFNNVNEEYISINFAGRLGYLRKSDLQIGSYMYATEYPYTLSNLLNEQMKLTSKPQITQTEANYKMYVWQDACAVAGCTNGYLNSGWNVRILPNSSSTSHIAFRTNSSIPKSMQFTLISSVPGTSGSVQGTWYQIQTRLDWINASPEDVLKNLRVDTINTSDREFYQFLSLSESASADNVDINQYILWNKGILQGKGQAFVDAAKKYNINELYLIAHAILETGNGSSTLSNGVLVTKINNTPVEPKIVYNMFGISAFDGSAVLSGAAYAYTQGWFTPEKAIEGGAKFISERYINNPNREQNTIYKMRWDPDAGIGTNVVRQRYQYATDIGWARKIARLVGNYYSLVKTNHIPTYDVPSFQAE